MVRRGIAITALAGLLAFASSVRAQDAQTLLAEAVAEYDAHHYEEAYALFLRVHGMQPSARTERALGKAAFDLRHYAEAVRWLESALTDVRSPLTATMRTEVEELLARARTFVGHFTLHPSVGGATVTIDGTPVSDLAPTLDIGEHEIVVRAGGYDPLTRRLSVHGGETETIDLTLTAQTSAPSGCPAGQAITADTAGHCCWPAQVWSASRGVCIGVPQCIGGMQAQGETCVAAIAVAPIVTAPIVAPQVLEDATVHMVGSDPSRTGDQMTIRSQSQPTRVTCTLPCTRPFASGDVIAEAITSEWIQFYGGVPSPRNSDYFIAQPLTLPAGPSTLTFTPGTNDAAVLGGGLGLGFGASISFGAAAIITFAVEVDSAAPHTGSHPSPGRPLDQGIVAMGITFTALSAACLGLGIWITTLGHGARVVLTPGGTSAHAASVTLVPIAGGAALTGLLRF